MMAWHNCSNRRTLRVMLSSTRKIVLAPRSRASRMSRSTRSKEYVGKLLELYLGLHVREVIPPHSLLRHGGKTGVITAHHDFHAGLQRTCQIDDAVSGLAMKRLYREPDNLWINFVKQPVDSLPHPT